MADGAYHQGVICGISSEDFTTFYSSDLPFTEGIVYVPDINFIPVEERGKRFALALRTALNHGTPSRDLVLNVRSCKESDEKIEQSGEKLKVFLSENLLNKHELHVGEAVWVKRMEPFPLERVVLGIFSGEKYLWAQNSLPNFLLDSLSSGPVTVRENDNFYITKDQEKNSAFNKENEWSEMLILQCEPVSQGCITSETSLVISKLAKPEISLVPEISETKSLVLPSDSLENFLISAFTYNLPGGGSHDPSDDSTSGKIHQLRVNTLECDKRNDKDLTWDASSRVYVSLATLIDLHLFNGSWVKICANHPNANFNCKPKKDCMEMSSSSQGKDLDESSCTCTISEYHIVQLLTTAAKNEHNEFFSSENIAHVCPLKDINEVENGVVYITPLLFFNLFSKTSLTDDPAPAICIFPICDTMQNQTGQAEPSTASKSGKPLFATEAHIALVHSPHYKAADSFDSALASHFKVPRVLTVGDVFVVYHDWQGNSDAKVSSLADDQGQRNLVVYFKVTRLICEHSEVRSCLVDVEHSSLYQVSVLKWICLR